MESTDISLTSPDELITFGRKLGASHKKFLLYGELGAGKTTFVKGFAEAIGVEPSQVESPSYTYINIYEDTLLHVDMRRIDTLEKANEIDLRRLLDSYEYIALERPKREGRYKNKERVSVTLKDDELSGRSLHIQ